MGIIRSRDELKAAVDRGDSEIIVEGKLAAWVHIGRKITAYGAATLSLLAAAIVTIPFTAGFSLLGAGAVAGITGIEIGVVVGCLAVGLALLYAIWSGYEEIIFDPGPPPRLILRKRQST